MPGTRAALPRFPDAPEGYDRQNEQEFRRVVEQGLLEVANTATIPPVVQAEAVRSGTSATLTLTIRDDDRRVTAIEFDKREGSGAATGWVSSWDTSTGTIGSDKNLVRAEGISIPAGLDSAAKWRVKYRDQQGAEHIIGDAVPGANLGSFTRSQKIPAHKFVPASYSTDWLFGVGFLGPEGAAVGAVATGFYYAALDITPGATITGFRARLSRTDATNDLAEVKLYRVNDDGSGTVVGTATHTGTGLSTAEAGAFSAEDTTGRSYAFQAHLTSNVSYTNIVTLGWVEFDETVPDYTKT